MVPNFRVLLEKANERIDIMEKIIADQEQIIKNQEKIIQHQNGMISLAEKRIESMETFMNRIRALINDSDDIQSSLSTICLAGGCFWGMQRFFDQFDGVLYTEVGYANGPEKAPTYEEVCANSGHAETVRIVYDPDIISLDQLLEYYFMVIDPVSVNRQGHDEGIQYRTGIYYTSESQLPAIRTVYEAEEKKAGEKLAVEVEPLRCFFSAEEYHQKYLEKNPGGYCHIPEKFYTLAQDAQNRD